MNPKRRMSTRVATILLIASTILSNCTRNAASDYLSSSSSARNVPVPSNATTLLARDNSSSLQSAGNTNGPSSATIDNASPYERVFGIGQINAVALLPNHNFAVLGGSSGAANVVDLKTGTVVQQLLGHSGAILAAATSPDGNVIATGSTDHTVRLWEAQTGKLRAIFSLWDGQQSAQAAAISFTSDGKSMVVGGGKAIWLWDIEAEKLIKTIPCPSGTITSSAISPDGTKVVAGTASPGTIYLWDLASASLIRTLAGHTADIKALRFASDSKTLFSGSADTTIRIWDITNGRFRIINNQMSVTALAISPDGLSVFAAGADGKIRLWRTAPVTLLKTFEGHRRAVNAIDLAQDSSLFITGSADASARLWDANIGGLIATYSGHTGRLKAVAISPNGNLIATGAEFPDQGIRLWDVYTDQLIRVLALPPNYQLACLTFTPDGQSLLSASNLNGKGAVQVWNISDGTLARTLQNLGNGRILSMAMSNDGTKLVTGHDDQIARSWNFQSGALDQMFAGHTNVVTAVALTKDGTRLLTGSMDTTIRLWNMADGSLQRVFQGHASQITTLAFTDNDTQVLSAAAPLDASVRQWNIATGASRTVLSGQVTPVAFSSDGTRILTQDATNTTTLWDTATSLPLATFKDHTQPVTALAFDPNGQYFVSGSADTNAKRWSITGGTLIRAFEGQSDPVTSVAASTDGKLIVTGGGSNDYPKAMLWDAASGTLIRSLQGHTGTISAVALSTTGQTAVTGSADSTARLWDVATGAVIRTFSGHKRGITSIALSPDNHQLITGSEDNTAVLWNVDSGASLQTLVGHSAAVTDVAYSRDGTKVMTCSRDRTAIVWNATSGDMISVFGEHTGPVTACVFSADGQTAITQSDDRTIRFWSTTTGLEIHKLDAVGAPASFLALSSDGASILSGSDFAALLWNTDSRQVVRAFEGSSHAIRSAIFTNNDHTILSGDGDGIARLWNVGELHKPIRTIQSPAFSFHTVTFAPDGKTIITGGDDAVARLWDSGTAKELRTFKGHSGSITQLAVSPDGKHLLTGSTAASADPNSGGGDGTARLWDISTGQRIGVLGGSNIGVTGVASSPDSSLFAFGLRTCLVIPCTLFKSDIYVLRSADGSIVKQISLPNEIVGAVKFAPDGKTLYVGTGINRSVIVLDPTSGQRLGSIGNHAGNITAIAFAPKRNELVTGSDDQTVRVWNLGTGALLRVFNLPASVAGVAVSQDERTMVAAAGLCAYAWDTASGSLIGATCHARTISSVDIAPDNGTIVTGSQDKTAELWQVRPVALPPPPATTVSATDSTTTITSTVVQTPTVTPVITPTTAPLQGTLSVTPDSLRVKTIGATEHVKAFIENQGTRTEVSKDGYTKYASSDPAVVTVDAHGVMTFVAKGKADITVNYEGQSALVHVEVDPTAPEAVEKSIGPLGGEVFLPNGTGVRIPTGALSSTQQIRIEEGGPQTGTSVPTGTTSIGPVYDFTPNGLTFNQPMTLQ